MINSIFSGTKSPIDVFPENKRAAIQNKPIVIDPKIDKLVKNKRDKDNLRHFMNQPIIDRNRHIEEKSRETVNIQKVKDDTLSKLLDKMEAPLKRQKEEKFYQKENFSSALNKKDDGKVANDRLHHFYFASNNKTIFRSGIAELRDQLENLNKPTLQVEVFEANNLRENSVLFPKKFMKLEGWIHPPNELESNYKLKM